ncbi:MAG: SCO1/SenC family protein [Candidatus Tokpelaia sp. JSC161]|jgi:protein SCO1/2|nr:MAG: SCO1/SenC family protein [Candidatus Tokpelaia sp. JSC161]
MKKAVLIIIFTMIFIISVLIYEHLTHPGPFGSPFTLTDSHGKQVTERDIRAKPAVIFFGYTMCPDICPTTLFDLSRYLKKLGHEADKIGVWLFTVDPEKDTPQVLNDYISNFSEKIIGISGEPNKVHAAIKSFQIIAEKKVNKDNNDYTYDHTASIILLNKGGRFIGKIRYQEDEKIALYQLRQLAKSAD